MNAGAPLISVGVPIYNGARYLAACLECLQSQTFADIEVMVYDNASTDDTGPIAREFARRDPRFSYVRQPVNKGALRNFTDVLLAARRPFFAWRAADDLSDANYLETLHGLLAAHPRKDLAVSKILARAFDDSYEEEHPHPRGSILPGPFGFASRSLRAYGQSWFYGLFRREAITPVWLDVVERYGHASASDHLTMFPFLLADAIIGSNATTFIRGVPAKGGKPRRQGADRHDEKIAQRRVFLQLTREDVARRIAGPIQREAYNGVAWLYANAKVCGWNKVVRRAVQRRLAGQRAAAPLVRPRAEYGGGSNNPADLSAALPIGRPDRNGEHDDRRP